MKIHSTARFDKSYADAPPSIQRLFDKQARFLVDNPRHPSLNQILAIKMPKQLVSFIQQFRTVSNPNFQIPLAVI